MKIKHSKYRNTGLIFELLVKQIAADTLNKKESPAIDILRKHFTGKTSLVREFKLYEFILKNKGVGQYKAETILSTITEISRKLNRNTLKEQKYSLISDIKKGYDVNEFFSIQVTDYKALASLYCLLEAQTNNDLIDPNLLVNFRSTLLEHLTTEIQDKKEVKDTIMFKTIKGKKYAINKAHTTQEYTGERILYDYDAMKGTQKALIAVGKFSLDANNKVTIIA